MPTEPDEIISEALKIMHPDAQLYPAGIEDALHLSYALFEMVKNGIDETGPNRDAAMYIADRVNTDLIRAALELERLGHVLANRHRTDVAREIR